MTRWERLRKKIASLPNDEIKDILIEFFEAIEELYGGQEW